IPYRERCCLHLGEGGFEMIEDIRICRRKSSHHQIRCGAEQVGRSVAADEFLCSCAKRGNERVLLVGFSKCGGSSTYATLHAAFDECSGLTRRGLRWRLRGRAVIKQAGVLSKFIQ